jgi:hypothetical protein
MTKLLIAAVAVSAIAAFNLAPQPAQARHCSLVTATAQGFTQGMATRRADRRLRRYARRNLSGWHVVAGPRNACQGWGAAGAGLRPTCKAAAVVCS